MAAMQVDASQVTHSSTAGPTAAALSAITSMATRHLHAELIDRFAEATGTTIELSASGGVDAARRVADGEAFDLVLLAADALTPLIDAGHLLAASLRHLVRSPGAVAVRFDHPAAHAGAPPDVDALCALLLASPAIGHSTGPSGQAFKALLAGWGMAERLLPRLVEAPPGVPVARLIAEGRVAVGIQQRSELLGTNGVVLLGDLPPGAQIDTVFAGAVGATSARPGTASAYLEFATSPQAAAIVRRHGMEPVL